MFLVNRTFFSISYIQICEEQLIGNILDKKYYLKILLDKYYDVGVKSPTLAP